MENFRVHVDMYMYMYSDLPHLHGADQRGVHGCAATVLRPRAIIFRISHVMYMGVGAGVGTLVMPGSMRNAALKVSWKSPGFFGHFFVRTLFVREVTFFSPLSPSLSLMIALHYLSAFLYLSSSGSHLFVHLCV